MPEQQPNQDQAPQTPSTETAQQREERERQWKPGGGQWQENQQVQAPQPQQEQSGYTHPALVGKSPQEVERILMYMDAENKALTSRVSNPPPVQTPTGGPQALPPMGDPPDSMTDPAGYANWLIESGARRTMERLQPMLAPILQTSRQVQVENIFQSFAADPRFPDFNQLLPQIRGQVNATSGDVTEQVVLAAYLMARGAASWGQTPVQQAPQQPQYNQPYGNQQYGYPPPQQGYPQTYPQPQQGNYGNYPAPVSVQGVPQHRPSNPSLPPQGQQDPVQLTEQEARVARENGMSPQEYKFFQTAKSPAAFNYLGEKKEQLRQLNPSNGGMMSGRVN